MQPIRWSSAVVVALGIAAMIWSPVTAESAGSLSAITGSVRDSGGLPVVGALVIVMASNPSMSQRMALTDARGSFSIPNLFAGEYSVKVTMPRFLPALKSGIQVNAGHGATLIVNLQNAIDIVRRAVSGDRTQTDEMLWTMRSSRSTQPILRLVGKDTSKSPVDDIPDYYGYFQFYS